MPAINAEERAANLQAAIKAVNNNISPNGLIPTLFIFGILPYLAFPTDSATPIITQRAAALRRAMEELWKHKSYRQI